ncbi:TPA: hypothetical protein ACX3GY_003323 [Vibrio parahaemolyticus]|nr:hypothetical protein [Vibrio vulnificus]
MIVLPNRIIQYKGGSSMVTRTDDPTFQCTKCYKPWFNEDLELTLLAVRPTCPHCGSDVRKLSEQSPLITE